MKYHDNNGTKRYETDTTGAYADNWNPSKDYGNEYASVHIRIHCPSYCHADRGYSGALGFDTDNDRRAFYNEAARALIAIGFTVNRIEQGHFGTDATRGKERLYLHPQDISGEVRKNSVREIAEALAACTGFRVDWVDIYETIYDMSDADYLKYLNSKESEIRAGILGSAKTKRRDLFKRAEDVAQRVAAKFRLNRVGSNDGKCGGYGMTYTHVYSLMTAMTAEGYLVETIGHNGNRLIRTINKAEQRERKLYIA